MFECNLDAEHMFGHHGSMTRTRVRRRRAGLAAALAVGIAFGVPAAAATMRADTGAVRPVGAREYVVAPGDTLWDIARRADPGRDPREVIDRIERANGVRPGSLQPGRLLVVPVAG